MTSWPVTPAIRERRQRSEGMTLDCWRRSRIVIGWSAAIIMFAPVAVQQAMYQWRSPSSTVLAMADDR
jgi:hypothetical protein